MGAVRYLGEEDAVIAFGTDVWLQDASGAVVDLEALLETVRASPPRACPPRSP